jgi:hypothetical protein
MEQRISVPIVDELAQLASYGYRGGMTENDKDTTGTYCSSTCSSPRVIYCIHALFGLFVGL